MLNLTQTLALELAPRGIRVNAVSPGPVATEAFREVLGVSDHLDELQATIPLGRLGTPDDIAAAVVFLASPAAEWGDRPEPARGRRAGPNAATSTNHGRKGEGSTWTSRARCCSPPAAGPASPRLQRGGSPPEGGGSRIVDLDAAKAEEVAEGIDGAIGSALTWPTSRRSRRRGRDPRGARAHRLRAQRRRPRRVRPDRGVDARRLEPDDGRPRRRHVPRVQARAADHARSRGAGRSSTSPRRRR